MIVAGRQTIARSRAALFGFLLALSALAIVPLLLFHFAQLHDADKTTQPPSRARNARWDKRAVDIRAKSLQAAVRSGHEKLHHGLSAIQKDNEHAQPTRAEIAAGSTAASRHQHTNRTPLTHAEEALREPSSASLRGGDNSSADGSIRGQLDSTALRPVPAHSAATASSPRPPPAPVRSGVDNVAATAADCDRDSEKRLMTPWDEPEATSPSGEECSVHSDSLNAVFHQRFEYAPGTLKIGGGYDSENCYTYTGSDCWVASERLATSLCATPAVESSPLSADETDAFTERVPGRDDLMWQLRRAINQGRISAPDESELEGGESDDKDDFRGGLAGFRFFSSGGGFSTGPWGRRALDVALDIASAAEWEVMVAWLRGCVVAWCVVQARRDCGAWWGGFHPTRIVAVTDLDDSFIPCPPRPYSLPTTPRCPPTGPNSTGGGARRYRCSFTATVWV